MSKENQISPTMRLTYQSILVTLFLIGIEPVSAQKSASLAYRDSIMEIAGQNSIDTPLGLSARIALANHWIYHDPARCRSYVDSVYNHPNNRKLLTSNQYTQLFLVKGWVEQAEGRLSAARIFYEQAAGVANESGDRDKKVEILLNLISTYVQEASPEAEPKIETILAQVDTSMSQNDRTVWIYATNLLARIRGQQDRIDEAIQILIDLLESAPMQRSALHQRHAGGIYNSIAVFIAKQDNHEWAIRYFRQSLENARPGSLAESWSFMSLANSFIALNEPDSARHYLSFIDEGKLTKEDCVTFYSAKARLAAASNNVLLAKESIAHARTCSKKGGTPEVEIAMRVVEAQLSARENDFDQLGEKIVGIDSLTQQYPGIVNKSLRVDIAQLRLKSALRGQAPELLSQYEEFASLVDDEAKLRSDRRHKELLVEYETREAEQLALQRKQEVETIGETLDSWKLLLFGLLGLVTVATFIYYIGVERPRRAEFEKIRKTYVQLQEKLVQARDLQRSAVVIEASSDETVPIDSTASPTTISSDNLVHLPSSGEQKEILSREVVKLSTNAGESIIALVNIRYISAKFDGIRIFFNENEESRHVDLALKHWLANYPYDSFFQIHKSHVINLDYIQDFTRDKVILQGSGTSLPIARDRIKEFKKAIEERLQSQ